MNNKRANLLFVSVLVVFTLLLFIPFSSASTDYVKGYISNSDDGNSPDGMRIKATNELGKIQYDIIGTTGNSRNYNQFQFSLQGDLIIEVIKKNDYYSESINFKTTSNKYDFTPEIKLLKETSFSKLGYEPFTITEKTEYDFSKNTIYVNITNNMPTDEEINVYHIFNKNELTDQINYDSIEILEEIEREVFEEVVTKIYVDREETWELKQAPGLELARVLSETINRAESITNETNNQKQSTEIRYFDSKNNQLDASKLKIEYKNTSKEKKYILNTKKEYIGLKTFNSYKDKTNEIVRKVKKPITNNPKYWKQEYKHSQEKISIKAGEKINLRLTYTHAPILQQNIPTDEENKYDIEVCTINKEYCTILDPTWYNSSWGYKKEITITETSGTTLGNYSSHFYITYDADMKTDFSDLRFLDSTESTELDYYIENKSDGNYANIWVKIPTLTASINTSIFMYYGNSSASSNSDISATYLLYDDFDNGNQWTTTAGSPSYNGAIYGNDVGSKASITATGGLDITYSARGNVWIQVSETDGRNGLAKYDAYECSQLKVADGIKIYESNGIGAETELATYSKTISTSTYADNKCILRNNFQSYKQSGTYLESSDSTFQMSDYTKYYLSWRIGGWSTVSYVDWVEVKTYASSTPTYLIGEEQSQTIDITLTTPLWETQSGQTSGNLTFLQTTKYINTTSISNVSYMTLTITDPDSTDRLIENMTNSSLSDWYSDTEFSFDKVGTWTIEVEGFKDGSSVTNSTTLDISINQVSTKDGWYGCSKTGESLSEEELSDFVSYGCDLIELVVDTDRDLDIWNETLNTINNSRNNNIKSGINFLLNFNLNSSIERQQTLNNLSDIVTNLTLPPYTDAIEYISLEILASESFNDSTKTLVLNEFATYLTGSIENQFIIYSKNYNNESLDSSYISFTSFFYLDNSTQSSLMQQENLILRDNTYLNRIYVNLNDTLMLQTQNYQNNILDNLRGSPTGSTLIPTANVAEINSDINDIVVFNNQSTEQQFSINVTAIAEMLTKDVWDSIKGYLIEKDTDGLFTANVSNFSATNIFMDDFSHIQYGDSESVLFKESASVGGHSNYTNGTKYDIYGMYGANDASMEIWDSTYKSNTFIDYYGWFNVSSVTNWSRYDIIIFDDENPNEVSNILSETESKGTRLFGYVAVADYLNTDAWVTGKKAEIDTILALNESTRLNIFIDGLDYQVAGVNFSNRMKELVDYIKIENNRDVGLNTYTAYQDFCSWSKPGGFCMRESCVRRWDGTVGNPTYSWENWTLELEKSAWFNSHGVQVMCQAFGDKTTSGESRIENTTTLQNAYFASLILGYTDFYMSQPDFQSAHEINLYDVGSDLSNTYSTEDDETYYRRYSNGIVYYNTSSNTGWIEDGREFDGINMCFNLIDASDAVDAEAINFAFNINGGNFYEIPATEIVWSANGNWYCKEINSTDYSEDGYYYIRMQPHNRNPTSGNAVYISNSINQNNTGRHSFWDNTAGGDPFTWNAYEQDRNWMVDIEINQTKSTSTDNTNQITQSTSSDTFQTNLTLSSIYHQDIEVRSTFILQDMTDFGNLSYWNGTESIVLNYVNSTDCSSNNPTFNTTTINGEIHKACLNNNGFRVETPHLSTQIYILDLLISDISAPELLITSPLNISYSSDRTILNFTVNDTDGNLDTCWYSLNGGVNTTTSCSVAVENITSVEGLNTWNIYANDTYGNENSSIVSFTVDTIAPVITIVNPVFEEDEKTQPVEFIVSLSELGTCKTNIYGENHTMTTTDNLLFRYSQSVNIGLNTVVFYCEDPLLNSGNISTNFYMYPSSEGGSSPSSPSVPVVHEIPEEPEIEPVEVISDKKTTILELTEKATDNIKESAETIKNNVLEDWEWYLIGGAVVLIIFLSYFFFKE